VQKKVERAKDIRLHHEGEAPQLILLKLMAGGK